MNEQGSPAACCKGAQCRHCLREFLIWPTKFWFLSPNPLLWSTRDRFQETYVKYSTPEIPKLWCEQGSFVMQTPGSSSPSSAGKVFEWSLCLLGSVVGNVDWETYQVTLLTGTAEQTDPCKYWSSQRGVTLMKLLLSSLLPRMFMSSWR